MKCSPPYETLDFYSRSALLQKMRASSPTLAGSALYRALALVAILASIVDGRLGSPPPIVLCPLISSTPGAGYWSTSYRDVPTLTFPYTRLPKFSLARCDRRDVWDRLRQSKSSSNCINDLVQNMWLESPAAVRPATLPPARALGSLPCCWLSTWHRVDPHGAGWSRAYSEE